MVELKSLLQRGEAVLAVSLGGFAPTAVDVVARHGAGVLFIDCERSPISIDQVQILARCASASGIASLVRVESRDPAIVIRYLDCGVDGIVAPQIENAAQCDSLVDAARIQTRGQVDRLAFVAQIESVGGIAALDEIADHPGVDAILIGPNDLSHSMGFVGDTSRPELVAAVDGVAARLAGKRKPFGLPANAANIRGWRGKGASLFYITLDQLLGQGMKTLKEEMS